MVLAPAQVLPAFGSQAYVRCLYCTLMHAVENKEWLEEYEVLLELYRR
jgi:hypothetical protein